jgi:predicted  nucleic acid-binding Zn-ribbon protein
MNKREKYIQALHEKIDEWNYEIDRLKMRKDIIEGESRLALQKQIDSLKQKRSELEGQLDTLRSTSTEAWEDLKSGIDMALESMNSAVRSAVSRFLK